ncbi:MAG TPA: hypothetical protein VFS66_10905 [Acidimicrobiia bacterium]|nr:hypothetical protein [Acidimicrobiia bacterium]
MTEEQQASDFQKWVDEAEAALNRTTEALRAAWEGTKGSRMKTLEAAKEAAAQLGKAIDEGLVAARDTWSARSEPTTEEVASEEE